MGVRERTMEKPCLTDQDEYPDDAVLGRCLGEAKKAWDSFVAFVQENYPSFSGQWRYYQDGKRWLHKLTKKKQTICWISVWQGAFKTTFYFADKAGELIVSSRLRREYIDQFVHGKKYGKIRGVTVLIRKSSDLNATKCLIEIKEQLK
jgi:hypothetical protein